MSKNQRFCKVLIDHGISQSEYARRVGVSSSAVGSWCRDGGSLGFDPIERLLFEFPDVDARWLITGMVGNELVVGDGSNQFSSEVLNLNSLIEYLRDDIKRLNDEVRKLMSENGGLRKDIEYLKDDIKNLNEEKEKLMIENQELRKD